MTGPDLACPHFKGAFMAEDTIVYTRESGMHYCIVNPVIKHSEYGGTPVIKPGIEAYFKPNGPNDQRAEFDPMRYANEYIEHEIVSGRVDITDEAAVDAKKTEIYNTICKFIERHPDYQAKVIRRKPGAEEIAIQLENQAKALEERAALLRDSSKKPYPKAPTPDPTEEGQPKDPPLVKGGGVLHGGATVANARKV